MAAVPVFHIKHCWVFVLVVFFIQRSHFHPLGRGGDNVILPGLLNPLARPETQRWEKLCIKCIIQHSLERVKLPSPALTLLDSDPLQEPCRTSPCPLLLPFQGHSWCLCVEQFLVSCNPDQCQSFHCWQTRDALALRAGTRMLQPPRAPAATLNKWDMGLISWSSQRFREHVQMRKHRLSPAEPWECSRQD